MILWMVAWMFMIPYCAIRGLVKAFGSKNETTQNNVHKKNPIDEHGDYNYGTIDWLSKGKL